ncbi:MAG: 50S ribosomal protein L3 [Bdellovibrionota bacterium]
MALGILGLKKGMTQYNHEDKGRIAVTLVEAGPCVVLQKKTVETDGYTAVKLAFGEKKIKNTSKAMKTVFEKAGSTPKRYIREFRLENAADLEKFEVGKPVQITDIFEEGQIIDVSGTSKGRGFTGVVKRWGFAGQIRTHGTHEFFRHGGSIGQCAWPGKVDKNKKMPGQYGNKRITTTNLRVVKILPEHNALLVSGCVPGSKNGLLELRKTRRTK